ncbi:MAG: DUF930 domain-containing protein [Hyphomicrobium sp.]
MRPVFIAMFVLACPSMFAQAATLDKALSNLDPDERARQVCSIRGIDQIRADKALPKADRIQPGSQSQTPFDGKIVLATHGAVRAKDQWFALKFSCAVTENQMKATSFTYEIGAAIPEEQWEDRGLFK